MRWVVEGIFFLGLIAFALSCVWGLVLRPLRNSWRRRQAKNRHTADWTVELDYDRDGTIIGLVHPEEGFDPLYRADNNLEPWDYDEQLITARLKAQQKADARNRRLP